MFWEQSITYAVETDIGLRRKNNEDAAAVHLCQDELSWGRGGHLFVVADGMGGHAVGELASSIAVETVPHSFLKSSNGSTGGSLHAAVLEANAAIHSRGSQNRDFLHMGTTCTSLALTSAGALIAHVGDSRAYRVRRDRIDQLTFDHSLEWELEKQHGQAVSLLDLSQHRNIITRSLGPEEKIEVDVEGPFPDFPGDTYVLCSDGLSNQVSDEEIGAIVRELPPKAAARLLVHLANTRGGPDNSTVIVVKVGDLPANVVPTVPEPPEEDSPLGWSWLVGFAIGALFLVMGVSMMTFGRPLAGSIVTSLSAAALLVLLILAIRARSAMVREYSDSSQTIQWRPYRTAVGLNSETLHNHLLKIDFELERSAREDGWGVDWNAHGAAIRAAETAAKQQRYGRAVRDLAQAIDIIMSELPRMKAGR